MNTQKKISFTLIIVMTIIFVLLIANIIFNFRSYGIKSAENKAKVVAETIKHSLTSHMVNGVIDNRELFLEQIAKLQNIDELWIVRAPAVVKQYGHGFNNEVARDDIDHDVLKSGKEKQIVEESLFGRSTYRVTIPYIVTNQGEINCFNCHEAKEGETLGAISITMTIDDLKNTGIKTVINTIIIIIILALFILIFVNKLVGPYLKLFDKIKYVMKKAQTGDYSQRLDNVVGTEEKDVAECINGLLEKLQKSLSTIESKIDVFLSHKKCDNKDPLIEVQSTVNRLSDIYTFRKTIEHDEKITNVYERLAYIIKHRYNINEFNFYEADTTRKIITCVYSVGNKEHCDALCYGCRADRTNTMVDSAQFENICDKYTDEKNKNYLCIPYSISNDLDLIISIVSNTQTEHDNAKNNLPFLNDYIQAVKPEIVSKKLMQILEKNAKTDALTGLYNRKHLEESISQIISQANRANLNYGILMCDIDYFKMINDTYGHDVGDEAIRIIAQTLKENTRESDIVIRYGGEEFIVLLYNCNENSIIEVAQKIRVAFSKKKISSPTGSFSKTISIGASIFPVHTNSFWQCVKYADLALYKAKNSGRNQVVLFDESLLSEAEMGENY